MRRGLMLMFSVLVGACGGDDDDPGGTSVNLDSLEDFCARRCEFQATCVPELRPIIGECRRQCRTSFDNPDLFTNECSEPSLTIRGDPPGPYTIASVVGYQECLITQGCEPPDNACEETRMLCLDDLPIEQRCQREARAGYDQCNRVYQICIEQMRNTCSNDVNRCYQNVSDEQRMCMG